MKVYFETYGCPMNKAESQGILNALIATKWQETTKTEEADCWVVNTCSVRASAEERVFGRIGIFKHLKETNKSEGKKLLVLTGCMADHFGADIKKRFPYIDIVASNNQKSDLAQQINSYFFKESNTNKQKSGATEWINEFCPDAEGVSSSKYSFLESHSASVVNALVPIMNGCNNFCSYCIIPYVRGREVSRAMSEIINEILSCDNSGARTVTLLGQNVNSYRWQGDDFCALVRATDELELKNIQWVYFDSPHPKDFSLELIDILSKSKYFPHYYHIPVQSGSTKILKAMNRHHTREDVISLFEKIKASIPDAKFSTDLMVGFPGETQEDFEETLSLIDEIRFTECYMYYWNEREGTKAASMQGKLSESEKVRRLETLIAKQRQLQAQLKQSQVGQTEMVIAESPSKDTPQEWLGKNQWGESVTFAAHKLTPGTLTKVRITGVKGMALKGAIVD